MMLESPFLDRAAGYAASAAMVSLLLAGVTVALFFAGAGDGFGPANDLLSALTLLLLILPVLAIRALVGEAGGTLFDLVSLLALIGLLVGATGQVLLVAGAIDLQASFVTGGLGILPVIAWAVALAIVALRLETLPDLLGWLTIAWLVLAAVLTIVASTMTGLVVSVAGVGLLVALEAWLGALAWTLLDRA